MRWICKGRAQRRQKALKKCVFRACFAAMDHGAFTAKKMLKVEKEVLDFYKHC